MAVKVEEDMLVFWVQFGHLEETDNNAKVFGAGIMFFFGKHLAHFWHYCNPNNITRILFCYLTAGYYAAVWCLFHALLVDHP